jgi:4-hydroxysphinganine ceramide fatty acyl 2-hydroxylase
MPEMVLLNWGRQSRKLTQVVFGTFIIGFLVLIFMRNRIEIVKIPQYFFTGVFSWTLVEYLIHRFLFHSGQTLAQSTHIQHHEIPNDKNKIVAPIVVSMVLYFFCIGIFYLMTFHLDHTLLLSSGLGLGYLIYEEIHYSTHHRAMKSPMMKYLKHYHMLHHHRDSSKKFGVSSPLWDFVFKTTGNSKYEA